MRKSIGISILVLLLTGCSSKPCNGLDSATLHSWIRSNKALVIVDVRVAAQYQAGHIPTALNIPLASIRENPTIVPRGNPVVLYCNMGGQSGQAMKILSKAGYPSLQNFGKVGSWKRKLVTGPAPGTVE